jgi:DNA-3-methyladenine glycosylase
LENADVSIHDLHGDGVAGPASRVIDGRLARVRAGRAFSRAFFERSCLEVAPGLIGALLVRRLADGSRLSGRIVEVEAYLGDGSDPGSHTHCGPTPRNRAMFGPAGHLYTYRSYGIHICANVVCEAPGRGAAVLLRAVEPLGGTRRMRALRGLGESAPDREIANGPGKLGQAFVLRLEDYGVSLLRGDIQLRAAPAGSQPMKIATSRRIGLSKGADLPYRFYAVRNPYVSRARP